jgi:DNA-binding transcriptional MerR regulator
LELASLRKLTKINHNRNTGMSLTHIKQIVGNVQDSLTDNPMAMWGLICAGVLVILVFGGLLYNAYIDWRHERQKAQAVERLHKHLQSLPGQKS